MASIDKGNGTTFFVVKKADLGKDSAAYGVVLNDQVMDTYVEKSKIKIFKKVDKYIEELLTEGVTLTQEEIDDLLTLEE